MKLKERANVVRAMELLVRSVNNEELIMPWLMYGVADGDINENTTDEDLMCYVEDDEDFAEIMALFLRTMNNARLDGGLYVDRVVSK